MYESKLKIILERGQARNFFEKKNQNFIKI